MTFTAAPAPEGFGAPMDLEVRGPARLRVSLRLPVRFIPGQPAAEPGLSIQNLFQAVTVGTTKKSKL